MNGIFAVVVTYRPHHAMLARTLSALCASVDRVVVVDNGSAHFDEGQIREACPALVLRRLQTNRGIAAAQNEGVALAREAGARYVLFLDQDSVPQPGMVATLVEALERLRASGQRVACVGPRIRLPGNRAVAGFPRLGWIGLRLATCGPDVATVECDFLLSSGMLVPMEAFDNIGGMEEGLFIDHVDTEWCLRAGAVGYKIVGVCHAVLEHRLGEESARIWLGRWRQVPRHQPFRYYYIFRNSLVLFRRPHIPAKWILFQLQCLMVLFLRYGVLNVRGSGELGMMLKGIVHGARKVQGKDDSGGTTHNPRSLRVSVCMAVHNGAAYLKLQLESILAQLRPQDELVVVDDCSADGSLAILQGFQDPRLAVHRNDENVGVIRTFERALGLARGDVIFLSDQDDVWLPGKLAKGLEVFAAHPRITMIASDARVIDQDGGTVSESFFALRGRFSSGFVRNFFKNKYLGCTLAFRRRMLGKFLPIPHDVPMHDIWLGLMNEIYGETYFIDEPLVAYRRHGANASPVVHAGLRQILAWRWRLAANVLRRLTARASDGAR